MPIARNGSCIKCHSEERSDEESGRGAGSEQIVPSTPRPFATLRVTLRDLLLIQRSKKERGQRGEVTNLIDINRLDS